MAGRGREDWAGCRDREGRSAGSAMLVEPIQRGVGCWTSKTTGVLWCSGRLRTGVGDARRPREIRRAWRALPGVKLRASLVVDLFRQWMTHCRHWTVLQLRKTSGMASISPTLWVEHFLAPSRWSHSDRSGHDVRAVGSYDQLNVALLGCFELVGRRWQVIKGDRSENPTKADHDVADDVRRFLSGKRVMRRCLWQLLNWQHLEYPSPDRLCVAEPVSTIAFAPLRMRAEQVDGSVYRRCERVSLECVWRLYDSLWALTWFGHAWRRPPIRLDVVRVLRPANQLFHRRLLSHGPGGLFCPTGRGPPSLHTTCPRLTTLGDWSEKRRRGGWDQQGGERRGCLRLALFCRRKRTSAFGALEC